MSKFSFHQIKFLSSSAVLLLCWQSLALANPSINKKLTLKKQPNWIAQNFPPNQDVLVPNPTITIDGKPVNSQPAPPPFTRAVAPPVGDMSVGNIKPDLSSGIDLGQGGLATIPRLVLRQAPANEVLALLARAAGYNIIFTEQQTTQQPTTGANGADNANAFTTISLELEGDTIQNIFNNVLMLSNLQASQRDKTIVVGAKLPSGARNLISRTIRLNQASPEGAANFLASQGAEVSVIFTPVQREFNTDGAVIRETQGVTELRAVKRPDSDNARSALPLTGLQVSTDDRTDSISLVGEANLVQMASSMLTQLDIRRRQVAVNVKVVDVQLNQSDSFGSSFSFGIDDTGVVQQGGVGVINFGTNNQNVSPQTWRTSGVGNSDLTDQGYIDNQLVEPSLSGNLQGIPLASPNSGQISPFGINYDPNSPEQSAIIRPGQNFNVPQAFLAQIRANISSGNGKILTDPTLVVQEGQTGAVKLVQNIVTSVESETDPDNGVRTTTPVLEEAGLVLTLEIDKIDDNGFINLRVNPSISAPGEEQRFESGIGSSNVIRPLVKREVNSGLIRLRDGQTLILSGIISDEERTLVSKIPVLGDLPIIGSLFRSTFKDKSRSEVIVMVTPQVIDDSQGNSGFGYNYSPSRETGEFLRDRGFNLPTNPY
jgi:type IV pilus assembly protein PilQ